MDPNSVGFVAILMSLLIPIVAIIYGTMQKMAKMKHEKEIKALIIEHNVDIERTQQLLQEQKASDNQFATLRFGCALVGAGIGAGCYTLLGLDEDLLLCMAIATGLGAGLLISFIIEMSIRKKMQKDK